MHYLTATYFPMIELRHRWSKLFRVTKLVTIRAMTWVGYSWVLCLLLLTAKKDEMGLSFIMYLFVCTIIRINFWSSKVLTRLSSLLVGVIIFPVLCSLPGPWRESVMSDKEYGREVALRILTLLLEIQLLFIWVKITDVWGYILYVYGQILFQCESTQMG